MGSESESDARRRGARQIDVVDPEMAVALRRLSPADRLRTSYELWHWAEDAIRTRLAGTRPEWSAEERSQEVARRLADGSW